MTETPVDLPSESESRCGTGRAAAPQSMNKDQHNEYITRNALMNLLSDDEVACVADAETAARLKFGEEYVDLEQPGEGVRRFGDYAVSMGAVLPRKSVPELTWMQILRQLELAPALSPDTMFAVGDAERGDLIADTTTAFGMNIK
jgi:hypothetical protein